LIASTIAASVVDLPEPVGPVTRISPRGRYVSRCTTSGRNNCSMGRTLSLMVRIESATVFRWKCEFTRKRLRPGIS
jgi:hypothetical protein